MIPCSPLLLFVLLQISNSLIPTAFNDAISVIATVPAESTHSQSIFGHNIIPSPIKWEWSNWDHSTALQPVTRSVATRSPFSKYSSTQCGARTRAAGSSVDNESHAGSLPQSFSMYHSVKVPSECNRASTTETTPTKCFIVISGTVIYRLLGVSISPALGMEPVVSSKIRVHFNTAANTAIVLEKSSASYISSEHTFPVNDVSVADRANSQDFTLQAIVPSIAYYVQLLIEGQSYDVRTLCYSDIAIVFEELNYDVKRLVPALSDSVYTVESLDHAIMTAECGATFRSSHSPRTDEISLTDILEGESNIDTPSNSVHWLPIPIPEGHVANVDSITFGGEFSTVNEHSHVEVLLELYDATRCHRAKYALILFPFHEARHDLNVQFRGTFSFPSHGFDVDAITSSTIHVGLRQGVVRNLFVNTKLRKSRDSLLPSVMGVRSGFDTSPVKVKNRGQGSDNGDNIPASTLQAVVIPLCIVIVLLLAVIAYLWLQIQRRKRDATWAINSGDDFYETHSNIIAN